MHRVSRDPQTMGTVDISVAPRDETDHVLLPSADYSVALRY